MKDKLLELGLKLQGRNIFHVYRSFLEKQHNTLEENTKIQEENLKKILLHSYQYVPYYRELFNEIEIIKDNKILLKNFNKIPILTKDIIQENFEKLKSTDPNFEKRKPYLNTSGGSTGEPVKFYQDNRTWTSGMAVKWLFYSFICDYPCKLVKLWGSERDILKGSVGLKAQVKNFISQRVMLNSFKMSEEDMLNYVEKINSFKPEIVEAYVQSVYEFAKFIKGKKLEIHSPKGVITSAGTLYPEMRELIEEVFDCKVFNRYGSREVGDIACSCSETDQLHLNNLNLFVEVLDKDLNPSKPGKMGKVYVTTLNNYSVPLIRYDIGDLAVLSKDGRCKCGRGFPMLESVRGRDVNLFRTKDGDIIDGEYFTHLFYMKNWVKKFQVIQEGYKRIVIKIELNNQENKEEAKDIEKKIRLVMGGDCEVEWFFVNNIKSLSSGKYLYTISKVKG